MEKEQWYNNPDWIVNLILGVIAGIVICSQSLAFGNGLSLTLFGSVINHNSIYFLVLIYFIFLKFSFGKKYFNYLNVALIFIYFISCGTSLLTVIQSFSLNTVLSFMLDFFILIYLIHTFLRGTRVWKGFKLQHSPFNEFTNDFMFYAIVVISVVLLAVNLINTVVISGIVLSCLDAVFSILFGRYIFLYREYLDINKIDAVNDGNFDEIKKELSNKIDEAGDKISDVIENTGDKIDDVLNTDKDKEKKEEESDKTEKKEKKTTKNNKSTKKKGEE